MSNPPEWRSIIPDLLEKKGEVVWRAKATLERLADSKSGYLHWTKLRHIEPWPTEFTREEGWALIQLFRQGASKLLPLSDIRGDAVRLVVTDPLRAILHRIDRHHSLLEAGMPERPSPAQRKEMSSYTLKALIEEAHFSAVIEGAVSTRKDAQKMIREKRKPKNKSEQMVLNNYKAGLRMAEWIKQPMSKELLCEIQGTLVVGTMENPGDVGYVRREAVQVWDDSEGVLVFTPPAAETLDERLERFCSFANREEPDEEFIHPIVKASLLHFQLAYDHPFADGNGRTARWVMLWFLLQRKEYWWFAMLSISRMTQHTRTAYYNSFQFAEADSTDATYLVRHQASALEAEMEHFADFLAHREGLRAVARRVLRLEDGLNLRQLALFDDLSKNLAAVYTQQGHAAVHNVVSATARRDLQDLVHAGLFTREEGRPVLYIPTRRFKAAAESTTRAAGR